VSTEWWMSGSVVVSSGVAIIWTWPRGKENSSPTQQNPTIRLSALVRARISNEGIDEEFYDAPCGKVRRNRLKK
jgi:hypothetical protein